MATARAIIVVAILTAAIRMSSGMAWGDNLDTVENSSPQKTVDAMGTKMVRGAANIATGWMEIPKQAYITSQEDGLAKGLSVGPVKGIGMFLIRTIAGAGEFVTFFIPYPGFFDPYFEPAFVWQKE